MDFYLLCSVSVCFLLVPMLWFKFIFGLIKIFQTSLILISPFVSDYDNEFETIKNKNQTGLKNFKPRININYNSYYRCKYLVK